MATDSIIAEALSQDYKISKFIDNWHRNRGLYANSAIKNGIKNDTVQLSKYCTDGKDDGKISTKEKIGNFAKGMVAPVTNMFKSPKNFIKGLGAIALGAGLIYITGGAAAPVMVAAGVLGGGIQIGKNAIKAKNAKNDKEAKFAWQGMGTGTTTVAASVAAAKGALKASGTEASAVSKMNPLKATFECFKKTGNYGKSISSGIKNKFGATSLKGKTDSTATKVAEKAPTETVSAPKEEIKVNNAEAERPTATVEEPVSATEIKKQTLRKDESVVTAEDKIIAEKPTTSVEAEKTSVSKANAETTDTTSTETTSIPKEEVKVNTVEADKPVTPKEIEKPIVTAEAEKPTLSLETEAPSSHIETKSMQKNLSALKEKAKEQAAKIEEAGSEIDTYTRKLLESTKNRRPSDLNNVTETPASGKRHLSDFFRRKK